MKIGVKEDIEYDIEKYDPKNSTEPINKILDDIQSNLHCCGALRPSDWNLNKYFNGTNAYPYSCCPQQVNYTFICTDVTKVYSEGIF